MASTERGNRAASKPGRDREPPGRKSGSESIPEPQPANPNPRKVPREDSRGEAPEGERGRGIPERKGGKL
jgi:hypothetical protein